tara:strand:- start:83 stop:262 length:180 start_codon:yes stop_codon:yes gene_type:complete
MIFWLLKLVSTEKIKIKFLQYFGIFEASNRAELNGNISWLLNEFKLNCRPEALQRLIWH